MNAKPMFVALVLAGALVGTAHAKTAPANPHAAPPVPEALAGLIDAYLDAQVPPGIAGLPPLPATAQAADFGYRHDWKSPAHDPNSTPPIPEPEAYVLLLAGLGALAVLVKHRNRVNGEGGGER